jgi:hypothetical protein
MRVTNRLIQLAKEPLLQFLFIGALIYGTYWLYGPPNESAGERRILVETSRIESFISQWKARWNRLPTQQELDGIINSYVREEILYRQAVAIGLNKDDPVTRRRMGQKLEFLTKNIALVVEPKEAQLEQYYADNLDDYRDPDLITFAHAFLDPDARDKTTLDDADVLLKQLRAAGIPDPSTFSTGDRFMLESHYAEISELGIRRLFGGGFSEVVMKLDPGAWHGPVLSGFGVHLVYVYEHVRAPAPDFAKVRHLVLKNWQFNHQEKFYQDFINNLKSSYEIVVAQTPKDRVLSPNMDIKPAPRRKQAAEKSQ